MAGVMHKGKEQASNEKANYIKDLKKKKKVKTQSKQSPKERTTFMKTLSDVQKIPYSEYSLSKVPLTLIQDLMPPMNITKILKTL
ncbi:hypothetical protein HHI36_016950 [Cryptolaemus montrouzieri]|uniref:Uncharacterized protein n=1 Tax=Cryptolaemus montrouzieri TaxID=559131 RepID=A0ABD2NLM5_9CUCU